MPVFRLARYSAGCFMFCTRAAFEACGGYDERLFGGEEIRFAQALKKVGRFWSVRVGSRHRALAVEVDAGLLWFWIGSHADYDATI